MLPVVLVLLVVTYVYTRWNIFSVSINQAPEEQGVKVAVLVCRVLTIVRSVLTTKMGCTASRAALRVFPGRRTRSSGNTQTACGCASSATPTAPKGKSTVFFLLI